MSLLKVSKWAGQRCWSHPRRYQRMESVIAWTQVRIRKEFRKFISRLSNQQICLRFDILFLATLEFRCILCYYSWLFIISMENVLIYLIVIAYNVKICKLQVVWGSGVFLSTLLFSCSPIYVPAPAPCPPPALYIISPYAGGCISRSPMDAWSCKWYKTLFRLYFSYIYKHMIQFNL